MTLLYRLYPELAAPYPCLPLASLPTPVTETEAFAGNGARVFIKHDEATSPLYGGNKARKLGWLLGAATARGAKAVITFGGAGSNHALATAVHAAALGMRCTSILGPQHNAHAVRRNLLRALEAGARLRPCAWRDTSREAVRCFWEDTARDALMPTVIPPGGSSPVGALGFVEAAFELREQVRAGLLPEPDVLYVPSGTMGTCVGLALGLAAAGLETRVEAVRVTTAPYTSLEHAAALFARTLRLLRETCPTFPECALDADRFRIRDEFFGAEYALHTPESAEMVRFARDRMGISLEGTYTGKALAALHADAAAARLRGQTALFWNTYNGPPSGPESAAGEYRRLPALLQAYFEQPVQPLDRV